MTIPPRPPTDDLDVRSVLLASARRDAPSAGTIRKARAALVLAATASAASATTSASAAGVAAGWAVMAQWVGVGAIAGLATLGVIHVISPAASQAPATSARPAAVPAVNTPVAVASAIPLAEPEPDPPPSAVASATRAPVSPAPVLPPPVPSSADAPVTTPAAVASSSPSLADEVALLDQARRALGRGDGGEAMGLLDRYRRDYPSGRLGHEATFVRIQALSQQGNRAAAGQLAEQFLQANPSSPLAPRVREVIGRQ